jgi:murein DD-endopeptidase MepM/ murein hydrolase activator NlpD
MRNAECGVRNTLKNILFIVITLWLPVLVHAETAQQPEVLFEPQHPGPGDIMVVTIKNVTGAVEGTFNGRKIYFNPSRESFKSIVGIDLSVVPGKYEMEISAAGNTMRRSVRVVKKKYGLQRLTLPKDMVELSPENEARVEREQHKMSAIWPNESELVWTGNFSNPLEGEIVTQFGVKRIINKIPKNPHSGVDVSGKEGDPVHAPNNAVVVLVDDQFYSGNSVVLDHGQGIYTMFFHLSKILVNPGQKVKKGEVIALVGSTGRSTGAHLHWGARVQGAKVNPLELIKLKLE